MSVDLNITGIIENIDIDKIRDDFEKEDIQINIDYGNLDEEIEINENEIEKLKKEIDDLEKDINSFELDYPDIICYYINLDRRKDRKEKVEEELAFVNNKIKYERIEAIDAKDLDMQDYINKKIVVQNPCYRENPFTKGHLACMLSHMKSWTKFLETSYKYCLILEDDIVINQNYFNKIFGKIIDKLDLIDFDWLSLGRQSLGYCNFYHGKIIEKIFYEPKFYGSGNHAYILNRNGAQNLVNYLKIQKGGEHNKHILPSYPLDCWDLHKRCYENTMGKPLKMVSIMPDNFFEEREKHPGQTPVFTRSNHFLFKPRDISDSDTSRF